MNLQKRASYNLVLLHLDELLEEENAGSPFHLDPWQKQNYRLYTIDQLFHDLSLLGISFDKDTFIKAADYFDTPEELADSFVQSWENPLAKDHAYLLLFELWRRISPEKKTLSIIGDELDHLIMLYDNKQLIHLNLLDDEIALLIKVLNDNVDNGLTPINAFEIVQSYTATDLEDFFYIYIWDLINEKNIKYGEELLENLYPYLSENPWFIFLKIYMTYYENTQKGFDELSYFVASSEYHDISLYLEVLNFLCRERLFPLFTQLAKKTLPILQNEEDLLDMCTIFSNYLILQDKNDLNNQLTSLLNQHKPLDPIQLHNLRTNPLYHFISSNL